MPLPERRFDCEVITPMFLAGADQQTPELRAPSIRGLLHWWFRAVAGGYCSNHIDVRSHEQRLFGGAGDTSGTASAVNVRVQGKKITYQEYRPLLHADYFEDSRERGRRSFKFSGIKPGGSFGVTLPSSPYAQEPHARETAEALFNLAATLGGLGRRSRRGFGTFQPIDADWMFGNEHAVEKHIKNVVREGQKNVKAFVGASDAQVADDFLDAQKGLVAEYPILHDAVADISMGEPTEWEPFIADLMWKIHARKASNVSPSDRLYSKVLGSGTPRQASTLLVSVLQLKNEQVVPVYTQLYCRTQRNPSRSDFDAIKKLPGAVSSSVTSISFPAP